jgi:hypothetical protein
MERTKESKKLIKVFRFYLIQDQLLATHLAGTKLDLIKYLTSQ